MSHNSESETNKLKLTIKLWEKQFETTNGRKPNKDDIKLADDCVKNDYKRYWKSIARSNMDNVWHKKFNKPHATTERSHSSKLGPMKTISDKMLDKYLNDNNDSKFGSFSLTKKTKRSTTEFYDSSAKENGGKCDNDSKIVLFRTKSVDESIILKPIVDCDNITDNDSNLCEPFTSEPLIDNMSSKSRHHVIVNKESVSDCSSNTVISENSNKESSDSISFSTVTENLQLTKNKNNDFNTNNAQLKERKRKSDVFTFDDGVISWPLNSDSALNSKNNDSNSMPSSGDEYDCEKSVISKKPNKFFKSGERRVSTYKGFGFNEDIKLTKIKNKNSEPTNETKNLNTDTEVTNKTKEICESVSTDKKPRKPKSLKTNFKRLNMKKKVFASRGYKKFNIRKYKYNKWKQMKKTRTNECYKCGQNGHWAQDCTVDDKADHNVSNDDDLKDLGISNSLEDLQQSIKVKPVLLTEDQSDDNLINNALREMGHQLFRDNQFETMSRILNGKSTILISSTGSGKSLCYQLPAYLYWKHRKAITIVISPLISLMEDQLTTFPKCINAVCIHSGLSATQKQAAISKLLNGDAQVVLLSPEAIVGGNTCINFNALPRIAFVCIDEAHCLSEWSNNFRPSYLQLYRILKEKLKIETFLALTATATKQTSLRIAQTLGLECSDIIGTTLVPKNLVLTVSRDVNKDLALIDLLKSERFIHLKSIIVYCTRREETERLASLIRISMQDIKDDTKNGKSRLVWDAQSYHAGKSSDQRSRVQKRFIKGDLRVVVATIAFGMGINKSDVRAIIHYNLPKSFENYMQEIGRAGRDGLEAHCHLFLDGDGKDLFELQRHIYANSTDRKCLRKLIEKVFKPCKCRELCDVETSDTDIQSDSECPGHDIAFPIKPTVLELDLKEETILTLLTYLELDYRKEYVKCLPAINSMCTVLCYGDGAQQMTSIAKQCAPIATALALHKRTNIESETPSMLKFCLVDVCSMLGQHISDVRRQLLSLEWQQINGRPKRTNVRIVFSDFSFHLKTRGDLTDTELNDVLEFLNQFTNRQEMSEIAKLRNVYLTFKQHSQRQCTNEFNAIKCSKLKDRLNAYFNDESFNDNSERDYDVTDADVIGATHVFDLEQARRDVRDLLSIHSDQNLSSARVIARIFHGIPSPRYPAEVWGKVRRFWRSNINVNFNELIKIANEEIIRYK